MSLGVWRPFELDYTIVLLRAVLPSHTRREVDGHFPGTDRCSSRLLTLANHLPFGSWLDYEADNNEQEDRHPVDFHQTAGGPGLRWRHQPPLTQTSGCTGEAVPPRRRSWEDGPQYQHQEDGGDANKQQETRPHHTPRRRPERGGEVCLLGQRRQQRWRNGWRC